MKKILPRKNVKSLMPYEPGKPIEELQRELNIPAKDIIKLASNENPIGPSPKAVIALRKTLTRLNRYPDGGCFFLKAKLAKRLGLNSKNIIMGNGSDELIDIITKAFLEEKDEVIISDPAFLEYEIIIKTRGSKIRKVAVKKRALPNGISVFEYDLDKILSSVNKKTKVIFMGNPDNPTGAYLRQAQLKKLLRICPKDVIIVLDEAYRGLITARDYIDTIRYIKRENLVILRTFSKAYGLAGLRIGYGLANRPLIAWMERVRQPFNVNMAAQYAAAAALDDSSHISRVKSLTAKGKKFLIKALSGLGFDIIEAPANFILCSYKGLSGTEIFSMLLKKGIILRDMKPYGLNNTVRISVGTMAENRKLIAAVKAMLS